MRSAAKIDEAALPIQCQCFVLRNILDNLRFVFFTEIAEKLYCIVSIPDFAFYLLIAIHDLLHACLDGCQVIGSKRFVACEVIVEAVFDGWSDRHLGIRPDLLDRLGEYVRSIVT